MKLRDFLKALPMLPFGAKAITRPTALVPPVSEFPVIRDGVIGLWVQAWNYDTGNWSHPPYLVVREFDVWKDNPYRGVEIVNCRRNKYWGRKMGGPENELELLCFERRYHNIRFFRDEPNTDWSLIGKGILW